MLNYLNYPLDLCRPFGIIAPVNTTREQIIQTTCSLLEKQGYHATGMNEIIQASGAPKGSLYYYFPSGKEELAEAAIDESAAQIAAFARSYLAPFADPAAAIQALVEQIADNIEASHYCVGGPLTTVAMETAASSARLNQACQSGFIEIQGVFAEKLIACGFEPELASQLAVYIHAAIEGGVLLSRTAHSGDPLRSVAVLLGPTLRSYQPASSD